MKRAAIGDVHLSGFQSDSLNSDGLPFRLGIIVQTLNFIIDVCRQKNIRHLDFVGDLINDKSIIYTVAQDAFKEIIIKNPDLEFTLISGNHDMSSTGKTQKSAISVFSGYPNVKCVATNPVREGNITYVPFCENFLELIPTLEENKILLSHLGLNEAMLQSGLSKVDKLRLSDLKKFKLIILGHYHRAQELTSQWSKAFYCGSILHKDWNDKNEEKRFLIYDSDTLEVESIPIRGFPQYKEFVISDLVSASSILEEAKKAKNDGHHVRIRKNIKDKLESIPSDILILEKTEVDVTNRGINLSQTLDQKIQKYLEIKEIAQEEKSKYLSVLSKYNIFRRD